MSKSLSLLAKSFFGNFYILFVIFTGHTGHLAPHQLQMAELRDAVAQIIAAEHFDLIVVFTSQGSRLSCVYVFSAKSLAEMQRAKTGSKDYEGWAGALV